MPIINSLPEVVLKSSAILSACAACRSADPAIWLLKNDSAIKHVIDSQRSVFATFITIKESKLIV
jgi:hypothetical protein